MPDKSELMNKARELAKEISDDLIEKFPGETITKQQLRTAYNIPWVKSGVVFSLLEEYGFVVSIREIIVPSAASQSSSEES